MVEKEAAMDIPGLLLKIQMGWECRIQCLFKKISVMEIVAK